MLLDIISQSAVPNVDTEGVRLRLGRHDNDCYLSVMAIINNENVFDMVNHDSR